MKRNRSLSERFWEKVNKNGSLVRPDLGNCWEWTATLDTAGYGRIVYGWRNHRLAHRISWFLTHGRLPVSTTCVCHACDNRKCVRPDHLFLGTKSDNSYDMFRKGRYRHVVGSAHPLAKLSEKDVKKIRQEYQKKRTPHRIIAKRYGMGRSTISKVISGVYWRHVA